MPPVSDYHPTWQAHHIVAAQLRLTEELQQRRAHETEEAKGVEVVKNGAVRERYRWTQELPEVTVSVELPPGTAKGQVLCRIGMQSLVVGVRGLPPVVHGALHARVRPEDCLWQLQDSHRLLITLPKLSVAAHECSTGRQKSLRPSARGHHAYRHMAAAREARLRLLAGSCGSGRQPCACRGGRHVWRVAPLLFPAQVFDERRARVVAAAAAGGARD